MSPRDIGAIAKYWACGYRDFFVSRGKGAPTLAALNPTVPSPKEQDEGQIGNNNLSHEIHHHASREKLTIGAIETGRQQRGEGPLMP